MEQGIAKCHTEKNQIIEQLIDVVKDCPDFPRHGILFKDIMPMFRHHNLVNDTCSLLKSQILNLSKVTNAIIGVEARGFLIGPIIAQKLGVPFVALRKKGKLPQECFCIKYEKEYGFDEFEIQVDALRENENVVVVDDLLATGGTLEAAEKLCKMAKCNVIGHCVIFELESLKGREKLDPTPVISLVKYD